ncbi:hypothetical protein ACHAAD_002782 [Klebsiella variicola]
MTNITELAQREKFEAWWEREYKHLESSKYTDAVPHIKYGFWMAYQAGGAELVEALEKAKAKADIYDMLRDDYGLREKGVGLADFVDWQAKRIAELESRTVKLPHRNLGHPKLFLLCPFPYYDAEDMEKALAAAGIKVEADSLDADVSNRNQPGMVVAVHIDVGDFVKFRGRVYEVKETDFDDHDVTLWFVCGEVLKCAAGCPIEVVSAPVEDE